MSEIKIFTISGEIRKRNIKIPFEKEISEVNKENALEKLFSELGSQHKAKRFEIKINDLKEKEK